METHNTHAHTEVLPHVRKFIQGCSDQLVALLFIEKIRMLERNGIGACLKDRKFQKVVGNSNAPNLYEIKIKSNNILYRFLFTIKYGRVYVVDGFKKVNSKNMKKHFNKAYSRINNI